MPAVAASGEFTMRAGLVEGPGMDVTPPVDSTAHSEVTVGPAASDARAAFAAAAAKFAVEDVVATVCIVALPRGVITGSTCVSRGVRGVSTEIISRGVTVLIASVSTTVLASALWGEALLGEALLGEA